VLALVPPNLTHYSTYNYSAALLRTSYAATKAMITVKMIMTKVEVRRRVVSTTCLKARMVTERERKNGLGAISQQKRRKKLVGTKNKRGGYNQPTKKKKPLAIDVQALLNSGSKQSVTNRTIAAMTPAEQTEILGEKRSAAASYDGMTEPGLHFQVSLNFIFHFLPNRPNTRNLSSMHSLYICKACVFLLKIYMRHAKIELNKG
jgi:hypothetical protein